MQRNRLKQRDKKNVPLRIDPEVPRDRLFGRVGFTPRPLRRGTRASLPRLMIGHHWIRIRQVNSARRTFFSPPPSPLFSVVVVVIFILRITQPAGQRDSSTRLLLLWLAVFIEPADDVENLRHMMARPYLNAMRLVRHPHQHALNTQYLQCLIILLGIRHRRAVVRFPGQDHGK
jgi:hypothetical protein